MLRRNTQKSFLSLLLILNLTLDVVLITLKKVFDSYMQWIASMRQSRAVAQVQVPISPSGIRTSEPALE